MASTNVAPAPLSVAITIDAIGGDGYLNNDELKEARTDVQGTSDAPAGTVVTLTIDGTVIGEAVVGENGRWSTTVDTSVIKDGATVKASVELSDTYGNEVQDVASTNVAPAPLSVAITIDAIGKDGYLNNDELKEIRTDVQGTSDAPAGTIVTLTIGDTVIGEAKVDENGRWITTVGTSVIKDGATVTASVEVSDTYGNEVPESASTDVAPAPLSVEITIDPITNDDVLNFSDVDDPTTSITGKVTGGASEGDEVTLSIGGETYTSKVVEVDGELVYQIDVPTSSLLNDSDLKIEASVTSSDKYGNKVTALNEREYNIEKANVVEGTAKSDSPVSGTTDDSDIVLADVKGNIIQQGQDYNICFVLDTSGSMYTTSNGKVTLDRITPAKNAILEVVKSLIQSAGQGAGTVTIGLITFAADALLKLTIDLSDPSALSKLEAALKSITTGGNTDYYDAFNAATDWFNAHKTGAENITYFITDGEPNRSGSNTGSYSEKNTIAAFDKLNAISDVEAIGLGTGVNKTTLDKFDSDKSSLTGIDPSDLAAAIQGKESVMTPGDDIVNAGAGNDIIFGDIVSFAGDDGTAADLRSYITAEMKLEQPATDAQMHVWITENQERLDSLLPEAGGKDALFGGTGNDLIFGGGGNDLLVGGEGSDTLYGGHGDDILIGDGPNSFSELANLLGNSAMTVDEMMNALRNDVSKLGSLGGGSSDDVLYGGDGNDLLYGGEGNDTLYGGTGNDILIGGKGDDTLYGGSGSDTFKWLKGDDGHDVIKDFRADEGDRIDLSDLLGDVAETDLASYIRITDDSNGNAVIEINTNGQINTGATMSITVENCSAGDFDINSLMAKPDTPVI